MGALLLCFKNLLELCDYSCLEAKTNLIVIILEQITEITAVGDIRNVRRRELQTEIFSHIYTYRCIKNVQSRIAIERNYFRASGGTRRVYFCGSTIIPCSA